MQSSDEYFRDERFTQSSSHLSGTTQLHPAAIRKSFLDFHQREYAPVIAFLVKCGAMFHDAEDAAQEAFLEAWRLTETPGQWETVEEPRGWIRTVALRKYYRIHREGGRLRSRAVEQITEVIPRDLPLDHGELTIQTEFVRAILRELDADTRVVMAFHIDGFKSAEIARHLGVSSQKIRDLTKKGRKALKEGLLPLRECDGRQVP